MNRSGVLMKGRSRSWKDFKKVYTLQIMVVWLPLLLFNWGGRGDGDYVSEL
jgi:hypothetical protein